MANQNELPFKIDETNIAGRDLVRQHTISRTERLVVIPLNQIRIRPGFNLRLKGENQEAYEQRLEIAELANGIFESNGPDDPLIGDMLQDGTFYINEGERRYLAISLLVNSGKEAYPNGKSLFDVEVMLNPKEFTDLDRMRKIQTSQEKLPLTQLEVAFGYLKETLPPYNLTHEQIAKRYNVSRQKVDNYILATTLPVETQNEIQNDTLTLTKAILMIRGKKKKGAAIVDLESGEILDEETASLEQYKKEKEKSEHKDGDEDDFVDKDNTKTFPGSKGGPKEESGEAILGQDSPYVQEQIIATWKQFLNRLSIIRANLDIDALKSDGDEFFKKYAALEDKLIERLRNEFKIVAK